MPESHFAFSRRGCWATSVITLSQGLAESQDMGFPHPLPGQPLGPAVLPPARPGWAVLAVITPGVPIGALRSPTSGTSAPVGNVSFRQKAEDGFHGVRPGSGFQGNTCRSVTELPIYVSLAFPTTPVFLNLIQASLKGQRGSG